MLPNFFPVKERLKIRDHSSLPKWENLVKQQENLSRQTPPLWFGRRHPHQQHSWKGNFHLPSGSVKRSDFLFQFLLMESNCINARKWDSTWSPESSRPSDPGRPAARRAGRARSPSPCGLIQSLMFEWREGLMVIKKLPPHSMFMTALPSHIFFSHLFLFYSSMPTRITWVHRHQWSRHRPRQKQWRSSSADWYGIGMML